MSKPTIVFVPGLGATGETYAPFLNQLSKEYEIRVADLPEDFPPKVNEQFLFQSIERAARGVERFILLGHSLGGNTALSYAATYPQRVSKVVAVAPPVLPKDKVEIKGLARFRLYRRMQNLALGVWGRRPKHAVEVVRARSRALSGGKRKKLYDWINHRDLRKKLKTVKNATVLWAKREEVLAQDHVELLKTYPNIQVKLIRGSHNNLALYPEPILNDVKKALGG